MAIIKPNDKHFVDVTGQQFNEFKVLSLLSKTDRGKYIWVCECSCGNIVNLSSCVYCGISPSNVMARGEDKFIYNGLDRVDSSLGYSISNCVPCCYTCNKAKSEMSVQEFKEWINRVHSYMSQKNVI